GLARLAHDDEGLSVELLGDGARLLLALQIAGFQLRALRLEALAVGVRGPERLALRQQEVARIAVAHAHHVAHLADLGDAFEKNDFHGSSPCDLEECQVDGPPPPDRRARRSSVVSAMPSSITRKSGKPNKRITK